MITNEREECAAFDISNNLFRNVCFHTIVFCILYSFTSFGQQLPKENITLNLKNRSLLEILLEIETRTKVRFMFSPTVIQSQRIVSVYAENKPLQQVLKEIFDQLHIQYRLTKNGVLLSAQEDALKMVQVELLSVNGRVTDDNGQPLIGVNITVKGANQGTTTDASGKYQMEHISKETILVFSYIGYVSKEIKIGAQRIVNASLQFEIKGLQEVVVVGYGEQKKIEISGAVSGISIKEMRQNPAVNLGNVLIGQTAGIIATQRSGEPGNDSPNIYIRGIGTTGDASPIYVIDGIVRTARDFEQLNVNEIQNFSVLKDAASAAVFGVRAGNGVVLVTTKRGSTGKPQFLYSSGFGYQKRTRTPQYLNSYELGMLFNEARNNQGEAPFYSESDLNSYKNQSDPDRYPDSHWAALLRAHAPVSQQNLSVSGGSDQVQFASSLSYLHQNGIIPSSNFKRYNFRSNLDADAGKTSRFSLDLSGRNELTSTLPTSTEEIFQRIGSTPSNRYPIQYSSGLYPNGPSYLLLDDNGYSKRSIFAFAARLQLTQQIPFLKGTNLKLISSFDKTLSDCKIWNNPVIPYYSLQTDGSFNKEPLGISSLKQEHTDGQSVTLETHLNYERLLNHGRFNALLLYTQTRQKGNNLSAYREKYALAIDELDFGGPVNRTNGGFSSSSGRRGVVGRLNYLIGKKLDFQSSFRWDGSEQFAKGKRWGFFPSVSAGWVISGENFLRSVKNINHIKLRGSYGILGNDRIGGARFLYLQSYRVSGNAVFGNGQVEQTISEDNLANPGVTWETVKKLDLGLDAIFFNGKLTVVLDYFYDRRSDILGYRNASVPAILGVQPPVENFAKVDNRGIELTLGYSGRISSRVKYSMSTNLTYARNKIVFIDEPASTNPNIRRTANSLNTEFGYQAIGIFQSRSEVDAAASQIGITAPGDIRYKDVNRDGRIDDHDRVKIGKANTPEIIMGYSGRLNYQNFEVSFLFQAAALVNQWYRGESVWPFFVGAGATQQNLDRWTPSNPNATEPRVLTKYINMNYVDNSSFWLKDASYLRLKSFEFAYRFPKSIFGKSAVTGLRCFVNANNIFTWTKIKNFDPENGNDRGWAYPQLKTTNAGLTLQF